MNDLTADADPALRPAAAMDAPAAPAQPPIAAPGLAIHPTVRTWLRLEGLAAFVAGLVIYGANGGPWLLVIPFLLVPDVSMLGYLRDARLGAFTYNFVHNWAFGVAVLGLGIWSGLSWVVVVGAILVAHVGMDRVAGYGLKLPSAFQDTHLGRIGKAAHAAG